VLTAIGQGFENRPLPSPFGPAIEAIVDGRVGTILGRTIAPAGAALEHMDDAANDPPIVISLRTGQVHRQVRCEPDLRGQARCDARSLAH
jgi:hypothetical protein